MPLWNCSRQIISVPLQNFRSDSPRGSRAFTSDECRLFSIAIDNALDASRCCPMLPRRMIPGSSSDIPELPRILMAHQRSRVSEILRFLQQALLLLEASCARVHCDTDTALTHTRELLPRQRGGCHPLQDLPTRPRFGRPLRQGGEASGGRSSAPTTRSRAFTYDPPHRHTHTHTHTHTTPAPYVHDCCDPVYAAHPGYRGMRLSEPS